MVTATQPTYDEDFYGWVQQQAKLLQAGRLGELDVEHLIEEIEDLGRSELRALESRLGILLGHLLKIQYQPDYPNQKSWRATVREQRHRIQRLLQKNPSLRPKLQEAIIEGYKTGINIAVAETPLEENVFPNTCPYTVDEILREH